MNIITLVLDLDEQEERQRSTQAGDADNSKRWHFCGG